MAPSLGAGSLHRFRISKAGHRRFGREYIVNFHANLGHIMATLLAIELIALKHQESLV